MCGISGIYARDNTRISENELGAMHNALVHRGPDAEGFYFNRDFSVGLAHRRLSIIDLSSSGRQPMCNEDERIWIVFNGEIYNYDELKKILDKRGHRFKSGSDTEVILHLYEDYGRRSLDFLRGMFALAIWDEREQTLFLARDRIGKKPLYYMELCGKLYFASEINALYTVPGLKKEIDPIAVDHFLTLSYIPSPLSIFKSIRKLPPAHFLIVKRNNLAVERYWRLDFSPKLRLSYEDAKRVLLTRMADAVKIRLHSDVPLGCFLSGGVDSSTITALMSRLVHSPIKTFSIGFSDGSYDETRFAREVAAEYKTDHRVFTVRPNALEILPDIIRHYGEPYGDSSAIPMWYLSKLTRQHVTVALNGDGGDEVFAGYHWYNMAHKLYRIRTVIPKLISGMALSVFPDRKTSRLRKARLFLLLMNNDNSSGFACLRTFLTYGTKQNLYHKEFLKELDGSSDCYLTSHYNAGQCAEELDRMLYTDSMTYLPEELLVKVDRATMAHSLEARSPFLDHLLMEFVARLPSAFKLRNGEPKHILKEVAKDFFSPQFLNRQKMGFTLPLRSWLKSELREYAHAKICNGPLAGTALLNMDRVETILNEHFKGILNHEWTIWNLLVLSQWMEMFL